jgi:predicted transcriptional regulator
MSGLTPQETKVMALRDRALTPKQIAKELGIAHAAVSRICSMYDDDPRHDLAYRRKMATASALLLQRRKDELGKRGGQ